MITRSPPRLWIPEAAVSAGKQEGALTDCAFVVAGQSGSEGFPLRVLCVCEKTATQMLPAKATAGTVNK